jgi:hypothetical protein
MAETACATSLSATSYGGSADAQRAPQNAKALRIFAARRAAGNAANHLAPELRRLVPAYGLRAPYSVLTATGRWCLRHPQEGIPDPVLSQS